MEDLNQFNVEDKNNNKEDNSIKNNNKINTLSNHENLINHNILIKYPQRIDILGYKRPYELTEQDRLDSDRIKKEKVLNFNNHMNTNEIQNKQNINTINKNTCKKDISEQYWEAADGWEHTNSYILSTHVRKKLKELELNGIDFTCTKYPNPRKIKLKYLCAVQMNGDCMFLSLECLLKIEQLIKNENNVTLSNTTVNKKEKIEIQFPVANETNNMISDDEIKESTTNLSTMLNHTNVELTMLEENNNLRMASVNYFIKIYNNSSITYRNRLNEKIKHMYFPDLNKGWNIYDKQTRYYILDKISLNRLGNLVMYLIKTGISPLEAKEEIITRHGYPVENATIYSEYMKIHSQYNIHSNDNLQFVAMTITYNENGVCQVDDGNVIAWGDDIMLEVIATMLQREIIVLLIHQDDVLFLSNEPISSDLSMDSHSNISLNELTKETDNDLNKKNNKIQYDPLILFMNSKGHMNGGDHYEPMLYKIL